MRSQAGFVTLSVCATAVVIAPGAAAGLVGTSVDIAGSANPHANHEC